MASIPENHRAKDMKRLDVDPGQLPAERVLGVEWCIKSYTFRFKFVIKDGPPREELSQLLAPSVTLLES